MGTLDERSAFAVIGCRLKKIREGQGISRRSLAKSLGVDVSSLAGWEAGVRLPREALRPAVARALGLEASVLFAPREDPEPGLPMVSLVDTVTELPDLLLELTRRTRRTLRALRVAAPYPTTTNVQSEWRRMVAERLLAGSLEVLRVEIIYTLPRLQELLFNTLRYHGRAYYVKSFCCGLQEVPPAMGGYFFDSEDFLLGAYWTSIPPHRQPGLRLSGGPFCTFFNHYWDEIWRRGTALNPRGRNDLSMFEETAHRLGLPKHEWPGFLYGARTLEIGDGAPPLI